MVEGAMDVANGDDALGRLDIAGKSAAWPRGCADGVTSVTGLGPLPREKGSPRVIPACLRRDVLCD